MNKKFPVYWGTDEDSLKKGVGMYSDKRYTVIPGKKGHVVLSGHRDTVFDGLDLSAGDEIVVEFNKTLYVYAVEKKWITHTEDQSVIVPTETEQLTLTTVTRSIIWGMHRIATSYKQRESTNEEHLPIMP
ncbi:sortase [Bacillus canaveralius]|uniref:sortase n=1 Tax=Bacillus canaveralius TaxID=1403243 RepID=UPI00163B43D5|nr:sortase [Bacillus canaveralius]